MLRGSNDPIASRAFVDALAAAAVDGRAYELPGGRHMAHATHARMVAGFLRRLRPTHLAQIPKVSGPEETGPLGEWKALLAPAHQDGRVSAQPGGSTS